MSDQQIRIGIDIGGSDIKFGATDLSAEKSLLRQLVKRPSKTTQGPQKTVSQILDGIGGVLGELALTWDAVHDVSVTVPCPCTPDGTIIQATNLGTAETKELWKLPFGEILADSAKETAGRDVPVFACNDANAAGQDDDFVRYGLDASPRCSVFITTGTGLGGCVIINGSVFFGVGQAGELGHMKPAVPAKYAERFSADPDPPCGCGGSQCVETRASLSGLSRHIEWALSDHGVATITRILATRDEAVDPAVIEKMRSLLAEGPRKAAYSVRSFFDNDGDPFCRYLMEDWAIMIGALFANIAPVLHPHLMIIGGGMTEVSQPSKDWFIGVVRRVYGEVTGQPCFFGQPGNCEIVWSVTQDQGWRGAILMGMRAHG